MAPVLPELLMPAIRGGTMSSDLTLAVGDGTRRMTYAELAATRGISLRSARQLTLRHHWHKQVGNDGLVVVSVPLLALKLKKTAKSAEATSEATSAARASTSEAPSEAPSQPDEAASEAASDPTRAFEAALMILREQIEKKDARIADLEAALTEERRRADSDRARAELRIAELMRPWWRRYFRW